jgi:hypothetical protein
VCIGLQASCRVCARSATLAGSRQVRTSANTVDGKPQPPVTVQGSQLYSLYTGTGGEHVLRLTIPKAGLSAFSFSFG